MMEEKNIGGVRLEFSIEFSKNDKRKYIDKVSEIQDKIAETINELDHNLIIGTGKAILKSEIR